MKNVLLKLKQATQILKGVKLTNEQLSNGSLIQFIGETPEVGVDVVLLDEAGNASVLPDGQYSTKLSNTTFTVKHGAFETVKAPNVTAPKSDKPILQAQSAVEIAVEVVEQAASGSTSGDTSSATTETKQTEVEQADVTPTETVAAEAANTALTLDALGGLIDKKLLPVWDAINALSNIATSYPTFLSSVEEMAATVQKLSNAPSASPIEKSINAPFTVAKDIKESNAYKILSAK